MTDDSANLESIHTKADTTGSVSSDEVIVFHSQSRESLTVAV
jgi:hypothetical protein